MRIDVFEEGPFLAKTYLVSRGDRAIVIDPGFAGTSVLAALEEGGLRLEAVLVTHGHVDHVFSSMQVVKATGAALYFPSRDLGLASGSWNGLSYERPQGFRDLVGGEALSLLDQQTRVLFTPGHTPGEVCFLLGDVLFSGDTLFAGTVGRTDVPADHDTLLAGIRKEILTLPDSTRVLPGHGPETTVRTERLGNPFFIP